MPGAACLWQVRGTVAQVHQSSMTACLTYPSERAAAVTLCVPLLPTVSVGSTEKARAQCLTWTWVCPVTQIRIAAAAMFDQVLVWLPHGPCKMKSSL